MGWDGQYIYGRKPKEVLINDFKSFENEKYKIELLGVSIVGWNEAYILRNCVEKLTGKTYNFVTVVLIRNNIKTGELLTKSMSEEVHPYYYNCPKKYLKTLGEPLNEDSKNWRTECWKRFKKI